MAARPSGTTIWVDHETAKLARDLARLKAVSMVTMFRDLLNKEREFLGSSSPIARVVADRSDDAPLPIVPTRTNFLKDPFPFENWINLERTEAVFLMGTTMNRAIVQYEEELWQKLLDKKKLLRVLLQGNLTPNDEHPSYTPIIELTSDVNKRRTKSIEVLSRLATTSPRDMLEVRNSGVSLLSYSAVIIIRNDETADIQIQPYTFTPQERIRKCARFVINTKVGSDDYKLLYEPILDIWEHSILELRSSGTIA